MTRRQESAVRLTHLPTGLSAEVEYGGGRRGRLLSEAERIARSWLAAKVARPEPPAPIRRTYTLDPGWAASVREGSGEETRYLVRGRDGVLAMLDGRCEFPV